MAVKRCSCAHDYQDKKYGKKMRVHNEVKTQSGTDYRCTVCGSSGVGLSKKRK